MYNPYLPQDLDLQEDVGRSAGKKGGLSSLLKALKLDDLDTGDVLLLLILLFLFLDDREDNLELLITLGLMLLL